MVVISDGTLSRHLQKMENDRLLNKVDAGRGGKVFYLLTIESKKKEQLHLLKFNPQYELFRGIYAYMFLYGMPDENSYASDNLQHVLSEIHASKNDLFIDRIEKCHSDYQVESQLLNAREKQLQVFVRTYYKPIAGTFITELISIAKIFFTNIASNISLTSTTSLEYLSKTSQDFIYLGLKSRMYRLLLNVY